MLNIDTQTLKAIQDNIKLDEWQELTQEKELVKTVSWKDFEIEGNKPNLIPNGWDSFEPYGFGEFIGKAPIEVFDENYAQNELLNGDLRFGNEHYWQDLPDEEKPVDVYEEGYIYKQPLGNGLTRIRTMGGSHVLKLLYNPKNEPSTTIKTWCFYAENISKNDLILRINQGLVTKDVKPHEHVFARLTLDTNDQTRYEQYQIRTRNTNDNLDFIASDPQIVEGDVPNAVMVVDTLDDGREHVRVFGANSETKLVYKGGSGVIGEPYSVETKIDNLGKKLNFDTNIGSYEIEKGTNDVSIQGELPESEFKISIGELK